MPVLYSLLGYAVFGRKIVPSKWGLRWRFSVKWGCKCYVMGSWPPKCSSLHGTATVDVFGVEVGTGVLAVGD